MTSRSRVLLAAFLVCVAGCGPKLTRYHRRAGFEPPLPDKPAIEISAFTLPIPGGGGSPTTILSLSPEAQAAFVNAVASKLGPTASPVDVAQALALPIARPAKPSGATYLTSVKRRVVFAINAGVIAPADRIYYAELRVDGLTGNATFVGWDKFATQYETVDLGKLTFSQQQGLSLQAQVAPPQAPGTALTAAYQASSTLAEEVMLRRRYRRPGSSRFAAGPVPSA